MMTNRDSSDKKKALSQLDFTDLVLSWSLQDILNENLYKNQVEKIPESFESVEHYIGSFVFPLLEETRAALFSSLDSVHEAPYAEVISLNESKPYRPSLFDIKVDYWRNRFNDLGKEPYKTLPGDVFVVSDVKPESLSDLQRAGRMWTFASVTRITEEENEGNSSSTHFTVIVSRDIEVKNELRESLFVVFLMNITTNKRIWNALRMSRNLKIIKEALCADSSVQEDCKHCSAYKKSQLTDTFVRNLLSKLNESQGEAILASLHGIKCSHKSTVELIWGPPGTGKTKTVSVLLFTLLRMNCRTLICAPTNTAINEVAFRVLKLVRESSEAESEKHAFFCPLGDILLYGNKERLEVDSEIQDIYLAYRVERLAECLGPLTGWRHCLTAMIDFLEDCVSQYQVFIENQRVIREKEHIDQGEDTKAEFNSFLDFVRDRFKVNAASLRQCIFRLCTHLPRRFLLVHNLQNMEILIRFLGHLESLLFQNNLVSEELEEIFSRDNASDDISESFGDTRRKCISVLKTLRLSLEGLDLPSAMNSGSIRDFCFQMASLIFCTASSSYKLHSVEMEPLNLLVIDEAAQLKECESTIPLQLSGLGHVILVGDECQLPAMVTSDVCIEAGFGRSLFERLSLLGHPKHLLNMQYRMHPSISSFPNSTFYFNQILDSPHVKRKSYGRQYLQGSMFGPYSFINVIGGKEEKDDAEHSRRNMVEVAVVVKILQNLYKEWNVSKKKISVGVISPYAAQVVAILDKLGRKFENLDGFTVKVKSIDGFQGGEEDIIIISTVRSNSGGSVGFLSSPQRVNVALTRARHRQLFFGADEDIDMAKTIIDAKKELDQLDDLLNEDSILFKNAKWKVSFSDNFRKSFQKLKSTRIKMSVIQLLLKLSCGWRPKKKNVDTVCESSSQILKQFKVEGLYIVCSIDIIKDSMYIQVLKVWDILPLDEISKLAKRLDGMFAMYSDDFINCCNQKLCDGDKEVPMSWVPSFDIPRFKSLCNHGLHNESSDGLIDGRSYFENSKVSESLSLMKFYSLSSCMVNHLLSDDTGGELDLPFEVSDEELEIIRFQKSTFILGRSGTGKTTVLTTKLFQKEQQHHFASKGLCGAGTSTSIETSQKNDVGECILETKGSVLRQLFVTVSPKLCYAIKQNVTNLKRFACGGNFSAENSSIGVDDPAHFKDIPDSFVDISPCKYPLVITFHKFLMMLDGTMGNSYFERFLGAWEYSKCGTIGSRSVALETFLRTKEVNYERFCSFYWPHFNCQLTKKLDPSRVFIEIMSHIKGGLRVGETHEGKIHQEDYVILSEGRVSTLSRERRERIYSIFQDYEKMKKDNGDFDLADFVNNLHYRLRNERFEGDKMDFIYVDEVQDLSVRQIALFKYICRNVEEGFVFAGDTAQTIARGIDFRFEDIRNLFYKEFILESRGDGSSERKDKGLLSKVRNLKQNFRTHDGVLRLAQSVIDLLYRFFHHAVDILEPETTLLYGEAPILLESGNDENAIITIFGKSGNGNGDIVGFGAEQVILVRDDSARQDISEHVGKQALVLTVVECKGLEFQDVLLYNFFGSSPLKNQWRVIYEFMKEQDLLDPGTSFSCFNEARHNVLCSELKQLYVAITRTRQRLWICENMEDLSKPMFDYWKKKGLVQVKQLDDSLAQAMQVASSPQEWKERGIKVWLIPPNVTAATNLFYEKNYVMAKMCFERAKDRLWEKRTSAACCRASADHMRGSNPEGARNALREAADIYDSIDDAESAAQCFYELGEYERAGRIYEKCGESELKKAGECFSMAGCHEKAAEVYARGKYFSECLSACTKGKLHDMGLEYIQFWKEHAPRDNVMSKTSSEIDRIEQQFLESCAMHSYELKDNKSMMKFVRSFNSMASRRNFLRRVGCLDELLMVEEESGNFSEAAEIAKMRGDTLLEADLLAKAGRFNEASMLILWHVFSKSLWVSGSKGLPLKHFPQESEILEKAKSFAKNQSDLFYEFVCTEVSILSTEEMNLLVLNQYLNASRRNKSRRGEILCTRRILDVHLHSSASTYEWEDELAVDLIKHSEENVLHNQISMGTLVCFWNLWKQKVENIFEYLTCLETQAVNDHMNYGDFCLNYFGVRRQLNNMNMKYVILNPDAVWVREIKDCFLQRSGNLVSTDAPHFVYAARSHWRSELLSVGLRVLETLEALHKFSSKNSISDFRQSMTLVYIFEVTKSLLGSKYLDCKKHDTQKLQKYFSECLSACTKGKLHDMGLEYIQFRKEHASRDNVMSKTSSEIDRIEQQFLESCAMHSYELKDNKSMMKFVRSFNSMASRRNFLTHVGCLDELLMVEEESGNFSEAAEIAKMRGDTLLEADLLAKAGRFNEASMLILWHVFSKSLWVSGSKGLPLKHFPQEREILEKAKSFAKNQSDLFYEFVCTEVSILSTEEMNLLVLNQYLNASRRNKSLRGEILCTRRILDVHLHSSASTYEWEDELAADLIKHSEENVFHNQISVGTLVCFWNLWKQKVENIFEYLTCLETQAVNDHVNNGDFCLNYFGVRQLNNMNRKFVILNSDAVWVREIKDRFLQRSGNLVSTDAPHFVYAARSYWRSELLSVGLRVLETLEGLHKFSSKNSISDFRQSMALVYIFEVTKSLLGSKYLDHKKQDTQKLQNFCKLSTAAYFNVAFPSEWRKSLTKDMISLRGSAVSRNLLEEVIVENISFTDELTYGQIGRVVMIWLGSGKPTEEVYKKISERFDSNSLWKEFVDALNGNAKSEFLRESTSGISTEAPREVSSVYKFRRALEDAYKVHWRQRDYISPACFMYLVERLLILAYSFEGFLYTTKSSFVEWLICEQPHAKQSADVANVMRFPTSGIFNFVVDIIKQVLYCKRDTIEWIGKSGLNFKSYYPLLLLRLVVMLCLLCVNCKKYYNFLFEVLARNDITSWLPREFYDVFRRKRKYVDLTLLAEAFMKIEDPLVIVSLGENGPKFTCSHAIFVDLRITHRRDDIMEVLFQMDNKAPLDQTVSVPVKVDATNSCGKELPLNSEKQEKISKAPFSNSTSLADQNVEIQNTSEGNLQMISGLFGKISDALKAVDNIGHGDLQNFLSGVSTIKVEVEKVINLITAALTEKMEFNEDGTLVPKAKESCNALLTPTDLFSALENMVDEFKQLSSALNVSDSEVKRNISMITSLLKSFHTKRPELETLLNQLCMPNDTNSNRVASETNKLLENEGNHKMVEKTSKSGKGKAVEATVSGGRDAQANKGKGNNNSKKGKNGKGDQKKK
ncbi:hypothetical protein RHMOL_Rhmol06G0232600 [Rhododendron molle]|uniref:Uncharacterized protein n=2 Tax=Rhododendron molle TaxID=49168 RepID=A0ACC0NFH5_RHOML|nr:hypothetical protein RHMOL_Rhmol06G0232600 [Rhododendron molle]KAI8552026.1 hypothetical protein RHMOL_Rhmol06G0232600 [Rhododendron molle]